MTANSNTMAANGGRHTSFNRNNQKGKRCPMRRNKNTAALAAFATSFLYPLVALAAKGDKTIEEAFAQVWAFFGDKLLPFPEYPIVSVLATIFTLVWLLKPKPVRMVVGNLGGPTIALFLIVSAIPFLKLGWYTVKGAIGNWTFLILLLGIYVIFKSGASKWIWDKVSAGFEQIIKIFTSTIGQEHPAMGWCVAGAVLVAGVVNGKWANSGHHYVPAALSAALGAGLLIWDQWRAHHVSGSTTCKAQLTEGPRRGKICGQTLKPTYQYCGCGAMNPKFKWGCSCGEKEIDPKLDRCPKCNKKRELAKEGPPTFTCKAPVKQKKGGTAECGAVNPSRLKFCRICKAPHTEWDCDCGHHNHADDQICGECGKDRPRHPEDQVTRRPAEVERHPVRAVETEPANDAEAPEDGEQCPHCHVNLLSGAAFCGKCGNRVEGRSHAEPRPRPALVRAATGGENRPAATDRPKPGSSTATRRRGMT